MKNKNYRWSTLVLAEGEKCAEAWKACIARAMGGDVFEIVPARFGESVVQISSGNRTIFRWFKK